jgi:hypothetical protein
MSEFGTDVALERLQERGGVDVASARKWLDDALACLAEPLDGFSVGNAANQTEKALLALGGDHDDTHACRDCRRTYYQRMGSYWLADDELWAKVVGGEQVALCPACFAERARKVGLHIHWRPEVRATSAALDAADDHGGPHE